MSTKIARDIQRQSHVQKSATILFIEMGYIMQHRMMYMKLKMCYGWQTPFCNIRDLNDPNKAKVVRSLATKYNIHIITLLKPEWNNIMYCRIVKKLGSKWSWLHNYQYSPNGRIWVGWIKIK